MNKENNFLPYELTQELIYKGFDEECLGYYTNGSNHLIINDLPNYSLSKNKLGIPAPLYQEVVEWFCEKHNIEINVLRYTYSGGVYKGKCYMWYVDKYDLKYNHELEENDNHWILNERKSQGFDFTDKREALKEATIYALTLI